MSGLNEEINTREEAEHFARSNPPERVLGLLIWNMMLMQKTCDCRLKTCRAEQKSSRAKNTVLQTVGGAVGGAMAAWSIWVVGKAYILANIKEQAIEYLKTIGK